jgi:hypothetical protein
MSAPEADVKQMASTIEQYLQQKNATKSTTSMQTNQMKAYKERIKAHMIQTKQAQCQIGNLFFVLVEERKQAPMNEAVIGLAYQKWITKQPEFRKQAKDHHIALNPKMEAEQFLKEVQQTRIEHSQTETVLKVLDDPPKAEEIYKLKPM